MKTCKLVIVFLLAMMLDLGATESTNDAKNPESDKTIEYKVKKDNGISVECYCFPSAEIFFKIVIDAKKFSKNKLYITLRCEREQFESMIQYTDLKDPNQPKIVLVQVGLPANEDVLKDWSLNIDEIVPNKNTLTRNRWTIQELLKEAKEKGEKIVDPVPDEKKLK